MVREHFTQKIDNVKHKLLRMGAAVEQVINMSVKALKEQDIELAKAVLIKDDEIDQLDIEIEHECMMLLALQQPLAKDLRTIATALKIITDLERMGDNAVNIAKIVMNIGKEPLIKPLIDIPKMAEICQQMVRQSLDAFVNEDIELAEEVGKKDEEVDELYDNIIKDIIAIIAKNNNFIEQGTKLMFVGRYLERIADHSTNICERIIFMVTGELKEIN
jgi:phosphate transport system protein